MVSFLDEIDRLEQSDFPYAHPREALALLKEVFKDHQRLLSKLTVSTSADVLHNTCQQFLRDLSIYLPFLGFILRATNVRNAFEEYGLLQQLADKVIGGDAKLIISSEWEFSPFTYRDPNWLNDFVLIGLPTHEASNPLLLPLAGHELGHSIWVNKNLEGQYKKRIDREILSEITSNRWKDYSLLYPNDKREDLMSGRHLFHHQTWAPASQWSLLQIEEIFCDFVGLRIFAEAYFYAFAYLLSPGLSTQRSLRYPTTQRRVSHLVVAARKLDIRIPPDYGAAFSKEAEPDNPFTAFLVSVADTVSSSLVEELVDLVITIGQEKEIPSRDIEKVQYIAQNIQEWVVPIIKPASLTDIVNAGWECNRDESLWNEVLQINRGDENEFPKNRKRILQDIMIKSMEIAYVYEHLRQP